MKYTIGLLIGSFVWTCSIAEATPLATSIFNENAEGWTVVDMDFPAIVGSPPREIRTDTPTYSAGGGSPRQSGSSGYIRFDDATRDVFYWKAPQPFLTNNFMSYESTLSFDLMAVGGTSVFNQEDVILVGGGITLVYDIQGVPNENWQRYAVWLSERAGWRVGNLDGRVPTNREFFVVIGNTTALYIRGEFRGSMDDWGALDNVFLSQGGIPFGPDTPEPATWMLLILAAAAIRPRLARTAADLRS